MTMNNKREKTLENDYIKDAENDSVDNDYDESVCENIFIFIILKLFRIMWNNKRT